jgi:hypothetical protein
VCVCVYAWIEHMSCIVLYDLTLALTSIHLADALVQSNIHKVGSVFRTSDLSVTVSTLLTTRLPAA